MLRERVATKHTPCISLVFCWLHEELPDLDGHFVALLLTGTVP